MYETWKDVPNTNGLYKVSDLGRVRSFNTRNKIPIILKPAYNKDRNYMYVNVQVTRKARKNWILHRLVATVFIENPQALPVVDHVDGNKLNNRAVNLEWVTHKENSRRAIKMGLTPQLKQGEGQTKLTLEEVIAIKAERRTLGTSYLELASKYNVKYSTIAHIMRGSRWGNVK